jgi:hypothetical protein
MIMDFLKTKVVVVHGSEFSRLEAPDGRKGAMNINIKLCHVLTRSWL